jgi:microcystin-dependent protein
MRPVLPFATSAVPVGSVVAFAGQVQPVSDQPNAAWPAKTCQGSGSGSDTNSQSSPVILIEALGWMVCDGRSLEATRYPELFGVLGYLYGGKDGTFSLPDYRGLFLRGVDAGSGMDPDTSQRTATQGGSTAGVGSMQCDALQTHQHNYEAVPVAATSEGGDAGGAPGTQTPTSAPVSPARVSQNETRPKNVYVHYLIRYRS